jgi:hypothetical protein
VRFLTEDRRGTAEQFATAFAVMARSLGYPTRVVVGYRVVQDRDGTAEPIEFVTSANYHAWAEVRFDGLGWVAYDPTPKPGNIALPPTQKAAPPTTVAADQTSGAQQTPRETGPSEGLPEPHGGSGWVRGLLVRTGIGAAGVVLCAVALAGAIVAAKARRRRGRQLASSPAERVVGAWDEVVDRLIEVRFPIAPSMTALDVARASRAAYGSAATAPLAFLVPDVSRAIYAADEPSTEAVERAWQRSTEFEHNLTASLSRRQRWRARLSLRPLRAARNARRGLTAPRRRPG